MLVNHNISLREWQIRKLLPNASSTEAWTVSQPVVLQLGSLAVANAGTSGAQFYTKLSILILEDTSLIYNDAYFPAQSSAT